MATDQEIRNIRLKNDYKSMLNIKGSIISWDAVRGIAPNIEAYRIKVNVRSITGQGPNYRDSHEIHLELPDSYPNDPPRIKTTSMPLLYHPNWFSDGRWCYGKWYMHEGLGEHVIRMIRTLQYDLEITNEKSPANASAKDWYLANRNRGIFPCDRQVLPDPSKDPFAPKSGGGSTFIIR